MQSQAFEAIQQDNTIFNPGEINIGEAIIQRNSIFKEESSLNSKSRKKRSTYTIDNNNMRNTRQNSNTHLFLQNKQTLLSLNKDFADNDKSIIKMTELDLQKRLLELQLPGGDEIEIERENFETNNFFSNKQKVISPKNVSQISINDANIQSNSNLQNTSIFGIKSIQKLTYCPTGITINPSRKNILNQNSQSKSKFSLMPTVDSNILQPNFGLNTLKALTLIQNRKKSINNSKKEDLQKNQPQFQLATSLIEQMSLKDKYDRILQNMESSKLQKKIFFNSQLKYSHKMGNAENQHFEEDPQQISQMSNYTRMPSFLGRSPSSCYTSKEYNLMKQGDSQRAFINIKNGNLNSSNSKLSNYQTINNTNIIPSPNTFNNRLLSLRQTQNSNFSLDKKSFKNISVKSLLEDKYENKSIKKMQPYDIDIIKLKYPLQNNPIIPADVKEILASQQVQALSGMRRFKKENAQIRNSISQKFKDTIVSENQQENRGSLKPTRKLQLPDIIRMSKSNIQDLSQMNQIQVKNYLSKFKKSIQHDLQQEKAFQHLTLPGKKMSLQNDQSKLDIGLSIYQSPKQMIMLEPQNMKKKRYLKQYGDSYHIPDTKQDVNYLKKYDHEFKQF